MGETEGSNIAYVLGDKLLFYNSIPDICIKY